MIRRLKYRDVFFAIYGLGPWPCCVCNVQVAYDEHEIHHKNGCHEDDRPENLGPAHAKCHRQFHNTKGKAADRLRRYWSQFTDEQRKEVIGRKRREAWKRVSIADRAMMMKQRWETRRRHEEWM